MSAPILVTGGTGTLGSYVVRLLCDRGSVVRVLSRKPRSGNEGVEYVVGDLARPAGVDEAVDGVDVIVHCASARKGDAAATRNLVTAAAGHGRRPHLVYISVAGVDTVPFGYFRAKREAEEIVTGSGLPWTLQRATQFYDFVLTGAKGMTRLPVVVVPRDFLCQPVDPAEVAGRLVGLASGPPSGRVPDMGGPEVSSRAATVAAGFMITERGQ